MKGGLRRAAVFPGAGPGGARGRRSAQLFAQLPAFHRPDAGGQVPGRGLFRRRRPPSWPTAGSCPARWSPLTCPPKGRAVCPSRASPFRVAYQDFFALVLDKPAGIAVHPTLNYPGGHPGQRLRGLAAGFPAPAPFSRPVNRIDKDTSGLVLAAQHPYAAPLLAPARRKNSTTRWWRGSCLWAPASSTPPSAAGPTASSAGASPRRASPAAPSIPL